VLTPPEGMELSRAMERLETDIIPPLRASGAIPGDVSVRLAGTADKLVATRDALKWNFLLALLITYLLLAALFEHFGYPLVILFSVPLAAVGGVLGLNWVHQATGHQLDVLTMLGFVILIGTVVNNAILIVHQALQFMRSGWESQKAILESVRIRVRPIFMSTTTSVGGMLPLVLFPGAGSELYRGLGSVVVGGLLVSTIFTLLVVPTLFSLMVGKR
ncbi:MAG: efflux RND transporter permease subunit, partial [Planctomycetota bacterium]